MGFEYLELGFALKGCLGGAFHLFWSVADHEILETICLADLIELQVLLSFVLEVRTDGDTLERLTPRKMIQ